MIVVDLHYVDSTREQFSFESDKEGGYQDIVNGMKYKETFFITYYHVEYIINPDNIVCIKVRNKNF